ncbi:Arylsulfatase [Pontiella desulfatans]|uniref:Arylsulfatase n=1 Tax=Pontiella desulfatans TaxID=2750659 RepID=A0A6C2UB52_PONDE|nr:sulfatase-like hydrolase/transferase [Pontiella desulfatans]SPS74068.1 sulfatase S1_23 [Kiritimatiellales bacterium]VGO16526.1 Arylsulfatase [Pontiella desulfatans]
MEKMLMLLLLAGVAGSGFAGKKAPPNVIVFLADDLGYGDLGCYGNRIIQTPHLDQFAREGVRLTDCHSGGTVCSPSRAALLTGRNPYRSGFFYIHNRTTFLKDEEVTLAEVLKGKGYETAFWGKWHLSTLEHTHYVHPGPGEQGFDYWMGTTLNAFDKLGGPQRPKAFIKNGEPVGEVDGWYCDVIVDDAREWLKSKRNKEKPFFMYVCSHEPHTPIHPPEAYSSKYDNPWVEQLEKQTRYGTINRPEKDISAYKKEYYGTVNQLDDAFGRLMNTLDEQGLRENTLVLFTSDNGPETPVTFEECQGQWEDPIRDKCFGTPGELRGMKRYPFEGGHRVPGIARLPGAIPAGSESGVLFSGTDILPTVCKLVGAAVPANRNVDGVDAFNAFLGQTVERKDSAIWFFPHHGDTWFRMPQVSMRSGSYSLIGRLPKRAEGEELNDWFVHNDPVLFELYDLSVDPAQSNDIAEQHPEVVATMAKEMTALWRGMRDEGLAAKKN